MRESIGLDAVVFIPCAVPPHKPGYTPVASSHRLAMLELALEDNPSFLLSDIEIQRGGISYTVDTLTQLRRDLGNDREIWLILGLDSYLEMPSWKQPDKIVSQCNLAIARRPGYAIPSAVSSKAKVRFVEITGIEISSSEIRSRMAQGKSIRYLVPHKVEAYIQKHGIYKG